VTNAVMINDQPRGQIHRLGWFGVGRARSWE